MTCFSVFRSKLAALWRKHTTPWMTAYLRALGARIGRDVLIENISLGAPDLLTVEDGVSIGTFVNIESLRATEGEPHLDIHPADAHARDIIDGAQVRIFNDRGSMQARARVTDRAREGLVVGLSIWWKKLAPDGRNANQLTSQALTDLGGSATFYDCLVEVERA